MTEPASEPNTRRDLRRVFEEMDRLALGLLPLDGGQGCRCGDLAQSTLLPEDGHPACTREQGQDPQHHERSLFPRDSMGMGRPKSNHQRSPERQTPKGAGRPDSGRDCGNPQGIARSSSDHGRAECLHWLAPRRTDRASLGGRGIRGTSPSCPKIGRGNGRRDTKDRSFNERRSSGCANGRVAACVESQVCLRCPCCLGVRFSSQEGQTTLLAGNVVAVLRVASAQARRHHEGGLLSHSPPHVWNTPERQRRKSQSCSGAVAACKFESDHRR